MDRRGVQLHEQGDRFRRARRMAVIVLSQLLEAELLAAGRFPQEIGVELRREGLRLAHYRGRCGRGKAQQDVRRLDLAAFAGSRFDLGRGLGFGQDGAGLEVAVLFENDVHQKSRIVWKWRSKPEKPWSPPSSMMWRAPA